MKLLPIGFKKLSNQDFSLAKTFLIIDISLCSCMVKRFWVTHNFVLVSLLLTHIKMFYKYFGIFSGLVYPYNFHTPFVNSEIHLIVHFLKRINTWAN